MSDGKIHDAIQAGLLIPYTHHSLNPATPRIRISGTVSHSIEDAQNPNLITDVVPKSELRKSQPVYSTPTVIHCGKGLASGNSKVRDTSIWNRQHLVQLPNALARS